MGYSNNIKLKKEDANMVELPVKNIMKQVLRETRDLNHDQALFFVWLCSVRALPFIGLTGSFKFLGENTDINKNLYSVINTIDIAANYDGDTNYSDARVAAYTTVDIINRAVHSATNTADIVAAHTTTRAAISAVFATEFSSTNNVNTDDAADIDASEYNMKLYNNIFEDISYIKQGVYDKFNNDISLYGDTWNNFQKALNDVGCGYWGRLYENIFQSRFKIDKKGLNIRLSRVPYEIKEQGAKAVADYLELMESEGSEKLNEARIIILGEKGAGKTCLARRLIKLKAPMTKPNESTEGVVSTIWKIKSKNVASSVSAHIWDFAGHVITHAAHRCFLSERCLYILVYDGRTERRNQIEYWLDHVRNYGGNAPVLILINMFDDNKPDIPENTLKKKYLFIKDFVYLSIKKDKDALKEFSTRTSETILNNLIWNSQEMPSSYYKVKDALRELFDKRIEYISKEQFYKNASENDVRNKEKQDILLEHLHWLGICL